MRRFLIVIPKTDGGVEVHAMKEWLRQHPERVPAGLDATHSTSHEIRNGLRKLGWTVQESPSEVRLMVPGARGEAQVDEVLGEADEDRGEESLDETEAAFALEYQLRDFLAQNLAAIRVEGSRMRLFVDSAGRDGVEYPTAVGPIDILATDDSGAFVVFELKRARSPDYAIGQLSRYMGWVKHTIAGGKTVRGIVVAKDITDKLRYAAAVTPNVSLLEYEVTFELKAATQLSSVTGVSG
jgi:endonuclease